MRWPWSKPKIRAEIKYGKDEKFHVSYRKGDRLVAESPPRGYPTLEAARRDAELIADAEIEFPKL